MARADDLAFDAEIAAQPDVQPIGQHHQPRRDRFAVRERELLAIVAGRDIRDLGVDQFGRFGDFGPNRHDQRVIHDAELLAGPLVEQIAGPRDPVFAVMGGRTQQQIGKSRLLQKVDLGAAAQLFDAKIERIILMRVDQERRNPGASEHRGRGRAGKAAPDNCNVGVPHRNFRP